VCMAVSMFFWPLVRCVPCTYVAGGDICPRVRTLYRREHGDTKNGMAGGC
jgi:hypothetical protein